MVTEELRRHARVTEFLLDDRPRGVAKAMRVKHAGPQIVAAPHQELLVGGHI
jgi:hypothetical protein